MKAESGAPLGENSDKDGLENQKGEIREKGRVGISRIPPQQARERSRRLEVGHSSGKWAMKAFTRAELGRKREEDVLKNQGGEFREKGRVGISRIPPQQARERSRRWELGHSR